MKKFILAFALLLLPTLSFGAENTFIPDSSAIFDTGKNDGKFLGSDVVNDGSVLDYTASGENGERHFQKLIEITVLPYFNKLLAIVAVLMLTWSGMHLMLARDDEELFKQKKNELFGVMAGFSVILLSSVLVKKVFFGTSGQLLQGEDSLSFAKESSEGILNIWKYS